MKHFTKLFAFSFITFPLFMSCVFSNHKPIYGNHQLVNQWIDIDNYDKVILNIPAEVFYKQFSDSAPYIQIHTDENIFKVLDVKVQNNQLIIDVKKDSIIMPSKLTIYTSSHNLNQVTIAGSGEIRLKREVTAININLNISGSGNFSTVSLLCETIIVNITGSGNTYLSGASTSSSFRITGSGNIYAFDFLTQELICNIIGAGNIEAVVIEKLDINITGAGDLSYRGNPSSINTTITGSGKVIPVN